jgi:hypothetical protein
MTILQKDLQQTTDISCRFKEGVEIKIEDCRTPVKIEKKFILLEYSDKLFLLYIFIGVPIKQHRY